MQWQKLKNVNVPIGVLLLLHNMKHDSICFAIRENQTTMKIGSSCRNGTLTGEVVTENYIGIRLAIGNDCYWCSYNKPME